MLGSRTGCLLDRDAVVTWADLDVQDVEVAPLLAEDGLATSTFSIECDGIAASTFIKEWDVDCTSTLLRE